MIRIQNKVLFKKYQDELDHLTYMNQSQPKEMKLFHGTGSTSPEMIWGDREDGFNINYANDSNLLGRGVYFAEKSKYSMAYKHKVGEIDGEIVYGMLLCSVIIGDSQNMVMSQQNRNIHDTEFKANNMRYESTKGVHSLSDVYVVYKNRRAYPLYFIRFT